MADDAVTMNRLMQEGKPFHIILVTAADTAEKTFVLDDDTYDGVSGYFENQMMWVAAIKAYLTDPAGVIECVRFDEVAVWFGPDTGIATELTIMGESMLDVVNTLYPPVSNVETKYGAKMLPIRNIFSIKQSDDAQGASTAVLELWGVYTPRTA